MSPFKYFILGFLIAVSAAASPAQKFPEHPFLSYAIGRYTHQTLVKKDFSDDERARWPGIKQLRMYRFETFKAFSVLRDGRVVLTLMVFVYKGEQEAGEAMVKLLDDSKQWAEKSPEIAFVQRDQIFRLVAECEITDESWMEVSTRFLESILGKDSEPEIVLRLACDPDRKPKPEEEETQDQRPTLKRRTGKGIDH